MLGIVIWSSNTWLNKYDPPKKHHTKENDTTDPSDLDDESINVIPGHSYPSVPALPQSFGSRAENILEIQHLEQELNDHKQQVDNHLSDLHAKKEQIESKV